MMKRILPSALIYALLWLFSLKCMAADERPLLHPLFSDHAVLQRGCAVPIWGWAAPGTKLTIKFAGQSKQATAAADGKWSCSLDPLEVSFESRVLTVETHFPNEVRAEVRDLLVGDVWLCSGQSNMEMGITLCKEEEEIAKANHPNLRLLTVPHRIAYSPEEVFKGSWKPCSPETITQDGWGGFSAAAYFFGKELQKELNVPIGLIHSSWGGTMIEAWTAGAALNNFPEVQAELKDVNAIANSTSANPLNEIMDAWFLKNDMGSANHWEKETTDTSAWKKVTLPNNYAACGIPGYEGVVWAQREIDLPVQWHEKPLVIQLGIVSDTNTAWLNGKEIGRADSYEHETRYEIPAGIAKGGKNIITLRITNAGGGGIQPDGPPMQIKSAFIDPHAEETITLMLSGEWRLQETAKKSETGRPIVGNPRIPTVLYNGMIAPLTPYALTGVVWYQGEANASAAKLYGKLLPAMITDWRKQFDRKDLAFHIVSLANYQTAGDQPRDDAWAELREAQAMTVKNVPNCGLAVAIDIGDEKDIHPKNKREVGHRLALSALAKTYKKPVIGSGPWFKSIDIEGDRIRIHFDHTDGGLKFKEPNAKSFAIAGADGKFVWAKAEIDAETVIVSSPSVAKPVAVRYAWDNNPEASLYNGKDLPAVPFRTDQ